MIAGLGIGFTKTGAGTLRLSGTNSYSGVLLISAGVVEAAHVTALGTAAGGTRVSDGATLQIDNVGALAEPLNIQGAGRGGTNGALYSPAGYTLNGTITLDAPATIRTDSTSTETVLAGVISGTGPLTKIGAGFLTFGRSSN